MLPLKNTLRRNGDLALSKTLTHKYLKSILDYNPDTGLFRWIGPPKSGRKKYPGDKAKTGYWRIGIDRKRYLAHRLAWFWFYGKWPKYDIDHIDGDGTNNRISNLRDVTKFVNLQNMKSAHKDSKSGLLGVQKNVNGITWSARIMVKRKSIYLGNFKTKEEAHEAYIKAKRELHEGNAL